MGNKHTISQSDDIFRGSAYVPTRAEGRRGVPMGKIVRRPWGERSFYAQDAWGNPLCFVERGTVYPG